MRIKNALCLLVAAAIQLQSHAGVTYRPGFIQAKFLTMNDRTSDIASHHSADWTPGAVMSAVNADGNNYSQLAHSYSNAASGIVWSWESANTTFGYSGQIYLASGENITFGKYFDDGALVMINGVKVLDNNTWNQFAQGSYSNSASAGWYPIEIRVWDGSGGKGPYGGSWPGMGLGYNTVGQSSPTPASDWANLGRVFDLSRFRITMPENDRIAVGMMSADGGECKITASFTDVPGDSTLIAYWDDLDRGAHDKNLWAHSSAIGTVPAGDTPATEYTIPGAAGAGAIRLCLSYADPNASSATLCTSMENWTGRMGASTNPIIDSVSVTPGYTNAAFAITVGSIGIGSPSAEATMSVAYDPDFANPAIPDEQWTIYGSWIGTKVLAMPYTNVTYYARLVIDNGDTTVASDTITFETLNPTEADFFSYVSSYTVDSAVAQYTVNAHGDDSSETSLTLQVSESPDFGASMEFHLNEPITGPLPASGHITATNLVPGTTYYARMRAVNSWNIVSYSDVSEFATCDFPARFSGVGVSSSGNIVTISLGIEEIAEGAVLSAALYMGGSPSASKTWTGISAAPQTLTHTSTINSAVVARYVLSCALGGRTFTKEIARTIWPGSTYYNLGGIGDLESTYPKAGDTMTLPQLAAAGEHYRVLNTRTATLGQDGRTLTALNAGATGVELWTRNSSGDLALAGTGHLIVIPERIGNGNIWRLVDGQEQANAASSWICISDPALTGAQYPNGANEIVFAIISGDAERSLRFTKDTTYGEMYAGQFHNKYVKYNLRGGGSHESPGKRLTFQRTDGKPGGLRLTGGCATTDVFELKMLEGLIVDSGSNGLDFDFGHDDALAESNRFEKNGGRIYIDPASGVTLHSREGAIMRYVNGPLLRRPPSGDNREEHVWFYIGHTNNLTGAGEFIHDSPSTLTFRPDCNGFSGTLVSRADSETAGWVAEERQGVFYIRTASLTNASLRLEGYCPRDATKAPGNASWGCRHHWSSQGSFNGNSFPYAGITSFGGLLNVRSEYKDWGPGSIHEFTTASLDASKGLTRLDIYGYNETDLPTNVVRIISAANTQKGTLYIRDERYAVNNNTNMRTRLYIDNIESLGIGSPATGLDDGVFPIVPWMPILTNSRDDRPQFASFANGNSFMMRKMLKVTNFSAGIDPAANVLAENAVVNSMAADKTINSLVMNNGGKGQEFTCFGSERKLTIASGALAFWNDDSKIGQQSAYHSQTNACGILGFPGTAYVYACANESDPNEIWATIEAPGGLVCGLYGALLLGGDQTGIDDEIAVNGGTLILGALDGSVPAQIDVPVRVVGGNSKLRVTCGEPLKNVRVFLDDVGGYKAKIQAPSGETMRVYELYVDGSTLPRGTYGATGSGADNIDDSHFAGSGIVRVTHDLCLEPTMILLR